MKKLLPFSLTVLALLFPSAASAGWHWVSPRPAGEDLIDFSTVDSRVHFALGRNGLILATGDAGLSWSGYYGQGGSDLAAISFVNRSLGCGLAGQGRLLKSRDGGRSWQEIYRTAGQLNDICFLDPERGFAVGEGGMLLSTWDGGRSWRRQELPAGGDLRKIFFVNPQVGFILDRPWYYWKSTDGGETWQRYNPGGSAQLRDLLFVSESIGFAAAYKQRPPTSYLYRTTDGGNSWERVQLDFDGRHLCFWAKDCGVVLSENRIYRTSDAGLSFVEVAQLKDSLAGVRAKGESMLFAFGARGVLLKSSDQGASWTDARTGLPSEATRLQAGLFTSGERGYLLDHSRIYRTTDSAASWESVFESPYAYLRDLSFPSAEVGYAVGDRVLKSTDAGDSWHEVFSLSGSSASVPVLLAMSDLAPEGVLSDALLPVEPWGLFELAFTIGAEGGLEVDRFDAVQFITDDRGFAAYRGYRDCSGSGLRPAALILPPGGQGCSSGFYVTEDGGVHWSEVELSPSQAALYRIGGFHFPTTACGYLARNVLGDGESELWKSTDGGESWFRISRVGGDATGVEIHSLCFKDEDVGLAGGSAGGGVGLYRTTDGGQSWEPVTGIQPDGGQGIEKILCDGERWWVLTSDGKILGSNDDGGSWAAFWTPLAAGEVFSPPHELWLIASEGNGLVLRHPLPRPDPVPPETPMNLDPYDGQALGRPPVALKATPFTDLNPGDTHFASQWQVATDSGFAEEDLLVDSGPDRQNLTSYGIEAGRLAYGRQYHFRVRYQDSGLLWSGWSEPTRFWLNHPPATPSIKPGCLPPDSVYYSTIPTLLFSAYADPDGNAQRLMEVRVSQGTNCDEPLWQSTVPGKTAEVTIPGGILHSDHSYCVQVRYKDSSLLWSDWSAPAEIHISSGPKQPANLLPEEDAEVVAGSSLQGSAFSDTFVSQQASQWQICRGDDFYCIVCDEVKTTGKLTTWPLPENLLPDRIYSWRVRYQNIHGVWSPWSKPSSFAFVSSPR